VRGCNTRLPAERRVRPVLARQRDPLLGRDAGLLHLHGHLCSVSDGQRLPRPDAGLRSRVPLLPRVQRRQRVRRRHPRVSTGRRVRSMLRRQLPPLHRGHAAVPDRGRGVRGLPGQRRLRWCDAGLRFGQPHLPGLRQ
jgi:hypothetical protein